MTIIKQRYALGNAYLCYLSSVPFRPNRIENRMDLLKSNPI